MVGSKHLTSWITHTPPCHNTNTFWIVSSVCLLVSFTCSHSTGLQDVLFFLFILFSCLWQFTFYVKSTGWHLISPLHSCHLIFLLCLLNLFLSSMACFCMGIEGSGSSSFYFFYNLDLVHVALFFFLKKWVISDRNTRQDIHLSSTLGVCSEQFYTC